MRTARCPLGDEPLQPGVGTAESNGVKSQVGSTPGLWKPCEDRFARSKIRSVRFLPAVAGREAALGRWNCARCRAYARCRGHAGHWRRSGGSRRPWSWRWAPRRMWGGRRSPRRSWRWSRARGWRLKSKDIYFQLRRDRRIAEDDVGQLRVVLNEGQRGRIQISFVPEAVTVAQAYELIL
jgi:hypothetical protein